MIVNYPLEKIFRTVLKNGGLFADLYYESSRTNSIVCDDDKIEKAVTGTDAGVGLRAIANFKTFYAYGNRSSERDVLMLAERLADAVADNSRATIAVDYSLEPRVNLGVRLSPDHIETARKVAVVREANAAARRVDPRIRQVKVVYSDTSKELSIANSEGLLIQEDRNYTLLAVQVVAAEKDLIQTGYEPVGGLVGFEFFDEVDPARVAEAAARRAVQALEAREAPSGVMPVILSSEAGGTMIHEAVGHGLEADLALEGLSVYSNQIGQTVASPLITVVDDATIFQKRGSYGYDDEGISAHRTVLVESGVLRGYLCDRLYAMRFNGVSTGNGRRQSYKHHPIVRMSNTFIAPGQEDPATIIRNTPEGLLVKKMGGGQVNTVNGDFVFEVSEGYLIRNGEVGDPVRGAMLAGNGPQVLKSIDRVGNDLGFGIGTCGKDGQGVPVADAQPTLRIPEIVVGGTARK
ncbi:MAG: TldD/PmbA family protein [Deltaproteobacteria bacterium]|nr:TldD/PmbA family protein [Deltaproteobacteria bacterium]MBW2020467.1 TldD/PmbA family protein [Deltaproteobacteria bacterium]MBW2074484.1 TldD/PmbA family protein [Deltaproteobacteria bacterium]